MQVKTCELLVSGYIRFVRSSLNQIIPEAITHIIYNYCHSMILFLALENDETENDDTCAYIQIADINTEQSWQMKVYEMDEPQTLTKINCLGAGYAAYLHISNIQLPQPISQKINTLYNHSQNKTYNGIFKGGGYGTEAELDHFNCIIYDETQLMHCNKDIIAYNYELPNYPKCVQGLSCVMNANNSIIGIGGYYDGYSNQIYELSLNEKILQWKSLANMQTNRYDCTSIMINNNTLMVIGGLCNDTQLSSVELYDFNSNKWSYCDSISFPRFGASAYYVQQLNKVYIGGACSHNMKNQTNASKRIEYYDIYKNKWYDDIYETNMSHLDKPLIWFNGINLLHIATITSGIEFMDLRNGNKKWNKLNSLQDMLKLRYEHNSVDDNCYSLFM
eukprot:158561_1